LIINVLAAVLYGYGHFFYAGLILLCANLFDILDGSVARQTKRVTRFGAFFDSVIDRYSDITVFVGIMTYYASMHSTVYVALCGTALVGSVLVSYTRARAESLIPKCKVGFLERPERVVLLIIASLTEVPWVEGAVADGDLIALDRRPPGLPHLARDPGLQCARGGAEPRPVRRKSRPAGPAGRSPTIVRLAGEARRGLKLKLERMKAEQTVCPCCGKETLSRAGACPCGARAVGLPLIEPERIVPKLGLPITSLVFGAAGLLMLWIKPLGLIALLGVYWAAKGLRRHRADASRYGGRRTALAGLVLSVLMVGVTVGLMAAGIPKAIRNYHARRFHTTVGHMENLSGLLREYRRQYGTYPRELLDLRLITAASLPTADFWEQEFRYTSTSLVAAKKRWLAPLSNYEIRSAGGDGLFGTPDDIIMQDDHLIGPGETNPVLQEASTVEPAPTPAVKQVRAGRKR
jgi:phosphatidylglycerophosphate synthase